MSCSMPESGSRRMVHSLPNHHDAFGFFPPEMMHAYMQFGLCNLPSSLHQESAGHGNPLLRKHSSSASTCEMIPCNSFEQSNFIFDASPENPSVPFPNSKRHKMMPSSSLAYSEKSFIERLNREIETNEAATASILQWSAIQANPNVLSDLVLLNGFQDSLSTIDLGGELSPLNHGPRSVPNSIGLERESSGFQSLATEDGLGNKSDAYSLRDVESPLLPEDVLELKREQYCKKFESNDVEVQHKKLLVSQSSWTAPIDSYEGKSEAIGSKSSSVKSEPPEEASRSSESSEDEEKKSVENNDEDREARKMENKRIRRMISNRESARRSRMKRQQLMFKLEVESADLRIKNAALQKKAMEALKFAEKCRLENENLIAETEKLRQMLQGMRKKREREEEKVENEERPTQGGNSPRQTDPKEREFSSFGDLEMLNEAEPLLLCSTYASDVLCFDALESLPSSGAVVEVQF